MLRRCITQRLVYARVSRPTHTTRRNCRTHKRRCRSFSNLTGRSSICCHLKTAYSVLDVLYHLDPMGQRAITDLPEYDNEIPINEVWYSRFFVYGNNQKYIDINMSNLNVRMNFTGDLYVWIVKEIERWEHLSSQIFHLIRKPVRSAI